MSLWYFLTSPPPPSIILNELHVTKQVLESTSKFLNWLSHSLKHWSHEAQPLFPATRWSLNTGAQTGPIVFHQVSRSQFHSKGQGDRLAVAYLMHMDAPSALLHNAKTQASFSALFLPERATCQTLHGISSTCWSQSDDLCKTLIEMQVIAAESPTHPPLLHSPP